MSTLTAQNLINQDFHDPSTVKSVISAFTSPTSSNSDKILAGKWLEKFKESNFAWGVCDSLLREENNSNNQNQAQSPISFFAAHNLKQKIVSDFHQLPTDSYQNLRVSLLEHLKCFKSTSNVRTQLLIAFADFTLQMTEWQDPLKDMISFFNSSNSEPRDQEFIIEYFKILPEEMNNAKSLKIGAKRRSKFSQYMKDNAQSVLCLIANLLIRDNNFKILPMKYVNQLILCIEAWAANKLLRPMVVFESGILPVVYEIMEFIEDPENDDNIQNSNGVSLQLHESAKDLIVSVLQTVELNHSHYNLYNNSEEGDKGSQDKDTLEQSWPLLNSCVNHSKQLFANSFEKSIKFDQDEKSLNIARVYITLSEVCTQFYTDVIWKSFNNTGILKLLPFSHLGPDGFRPGPAYENISALENLQPILRCLHHPNIEVVELTFYFFTELSCQIYNYNSLAMTANFQQLFLDLFSALVKQMCVDSDETEIIKKDHPSFEFRNKCCEMAQEICYNMGRDFVEQLLNNVWSNIKNNNNNNRSTADSWTSCEAGLKLMTAFIDQISDVENQLLPEIILSIFQQAENNDVHIALKATALELVGQMANWIGRKKDATLLESTINYVVFTMKNENLASICSKTLSAICLSDCKPDLLPHADALIQLVVESDQNNDLPHDSVVRLYGGMASILTSLRPISDIEPKLKVLLQFIVEQLASEKYRSIPPLKIFDKLAEVYRCVFNRIAPEDIQDHENVYSPVYYPFSLTWSYFKDSFLNFGSDTQCAERFVRLIRYGLRSLHKKIPENDTCIQNIAECLPQYFKKFNHSSMLYLAGIIIQDFGSILISRGVQLNLMWDHLICHGLKLAYPDKNNDNNETSDLSNTNSMADIPETIDDLFRLCTRICDNYSEKLMTSDYSKQLFESAIATTSLSHPEAHTSGAKFLDEIVYAASRQKSNPDSILCQIVNHYGQEIVSKSLHSVVNILPSSLTEEMAELWFEIKCYDKELFKNWMSQAINEVMARPENAMKIQNYPELIEDIEDFLPGILKRKTKEGINSHILSFIRLFR